MTGWVLPGGGRQVVFLDSEPVGRIPGNSRGARFGVVLDGEMTLPVAGVPHRYRRGDTYFIPAGVPHSAVFHTRFRAIDVFDEPARYRAKG